MSSDKGTVHVFTLDAKRTEAIPTTEETSGETDASKHKNPVSALSFVSVSPLHFSSVRIAIGRFSASGLPWLSCCLLHKRRAAVIPDCCKTPTNQVTTAECPGMCYVSLSTQQVACPYCGQ